MATDSQYKTTKKAETWTAGVSSKSASSSLNAPDTTSIEIKKIDDDNSRKAFNVNNSATYQNISLEETIKESSDLGSDVDFLPVKQAVFNTILDDKAKTLQLNNEDQQVVQNEGGYPVVDYKSQISNIVEGKSNTSLKYDYQIIPDNPRYPKLASLENKLRDMRASLGIPVHGRQDLAKAMKYYMYNRYKTPDINMAHNRSFTHVFFTRPDCNLIERQFGTMNYTLNKQAIKNNEIYLLWKRNPELFKLLVNGSRCGDDHNLNLLLSNQVTSIDIQDEQLSTVEAGKSWGQYEMVYGDVYTGRFAGEVSCNFTETNDYSVINLLKMWITYIDAVSRGAWSPSYNLYGSTQDQIGKTYTDSHAYTKTLDYASSIDVFRVGPDGEEILYWTKYYGTFPINTGAGALSWDMANPPGEVPKLGIRFKYSFKRDLSPISLMEFNKNTSENSIYDVFGSNASGSERYEPSYDRNYAGSVRPYVGTPYIEFRMAEPGLQNPNLSNLNSPTLSLKLKFHRFNHRLINDDMLYKNNLSVNPNLKKSVISMIGEAIGEAISDNLQRWEG